VIFVQIGDLITVTWSWVYLETWYFECWEVCPQTFCV